MAKKPFMNEEYCLEIYNNGFTNGKFNFWDCLAVAQYFVWELGYRKSKTKRLLIEFSEKNDPEFNRYLSRNIIKSAVDIALKKMFDERVDVIITKNEISKIKEIRDYKLEKFLFGILVSAKRSKYDQTSLTVRRNQFGYFISVDDAFAICRQASYRIPKKYFFLFVHKLVLSGFLGATKVGKIAILYADDNSSPVIKVLGTEDPVKAYVDMNDGELLYCAECGNLVKKESNRQKLCKECSVASNNKKAGERMKDLRKRS